MVKCPLSANQSQLYQGFHYALNNIIDICKSSGSDVYWDQIHDVIKTKNLQTYNVDGSFQIMTNEDIIEKKLSSHYWIKLGAFVGNNYLKPYFLGRFGFYSEKPISYKLIHKQMSEKDFGFFHFGLKGHANILFIERETKDSYNLFPFEPHGTVKKEAKDILEALNPNDKIKIYYNILENGHFQSPHADQVGYCVTFTYFTIFLVCHVYSYIATVRKLIPKFSNWGDKLMNFTNAYINARQFYMLKTDFVKGLWAIFRTSNQHYSPVEYGYNILDSMRGRLENVITDIGNFINHQSTECDTKRELIISTKINKRFKPFELQKVIGDVKSRDIFIRIDDSVWNVENVEYKIYIYKNGLTLLDVCKYQMYNKSKNEMRSLYIPKDIKLKQTVLNQLYNLHYTPIVYFAKNKVNVTTVDRQGIYRTKIFGFTRDEINKSLNDWENQIYHIDQEHKFHLAFVDTTTLPWTCYLISAIKHKHGVFNVKVKNKITKLTNRQVEKFESTFNVKLPTKNNIVKATRNDNGFYTIKNANDDILHHNYNIDEDIREHKSNERGAYLRSLLYSSLITNDNYAEPLEKYYQRKSVRIKSKRNLKNKSKNDTSTSPTDYLKSSKKRTKL